MDNIHLKSTIEKCYWHSATKRLLFETCEIRKETIKTRKILYGLKEKKFAIKIDRINANQVCFFYRQLSSWVTWKNKCTHSVKCQYWLNVNAISAPQSRPIGLSYPRQPARHPHQSPVTRIRTYLQCDHKDSGKVLGVNYIFHWISLINNFADRLNNKTNRF